MKIPFFPSFIFERRAAALSGVGLVAVSIAILSGSISSSFAANAITHRNTNASSLTPKKSAEIL
jgi:hypothetical protein